MKKYFLIFIFIAVTGCKNPNDSNVDGVVLVIYPDKNTLSIYQPYEGFVSLQACRVNAKKIIGNSNFINPDYECGSNCKAQYDHGDKIYICKTTER